MLRSQSLDLLDDELRQIVAEPETDSQVIHHTAMIDRDVIIGDNVKVGPFAVIDEGAEIGDDVEIGAYVYVGPLALIRSGTVLHPHVTIRDRVRIGRNVTINCGSVIGSDGFGFANNSGKNHKIPQVGTVEIEDDVWIGSNVTIDRATIGTTRVRRGAKIDNLAQIGHNVEVGEDTVIGSQVGIAGSTSIGSAAYIGEKVGITGHIEIGDNVTVYPFSGIRKGVSDGLTVMGSPAKPIETEKSLQKLVFELPNIAREFQRLKRRLTAGKK